MTFMIRTDEERRKVMYLALQEATFSPDPSTQNGAVIVPALRDLELSIDCNRFPRDVLHNPERWERPLKYSFVEHAERNAIYNAAAMGIPTHGATMFCPWAACADCARAIIASEIRALVRLGSMLNTNERWDDSVRVGDLMLHEAGVEIIDLPVGEPYGFTILRNGESVEF